MKQAYDIKQVIRGLTFIFIQRSTCTWVMIKSHVYSHFMYESAFSVCNWIPVAVADDTFLTHGGFSDIITPGTLIWQMHIHEWARVEVPKMIQGFLPIGSMLYWLTHTLDSYSLKENSWGSYQRLSRHVSLFFKKMKRSCGP